MDVQSVVQVSQRAIRNTQDCETMCVQTVQYCMIMGGAHTEPSHMQLLQDCADICETAARIVSRGSPRHRELATACANVCDLCAAACEKFIGDPHMKACANQCYLCASACRQLVSTTAGAGDAALRNMAAPTTGLHGGLHP